MTAQNTAFETLLPDGWPRGQGYANGVAARGRTIFISGQIGWNPHSCQLDTDDFAEQTAQTFRNIVAVLRAGGGDPSHLVRLTWFITDKAAYLAARKQIGAAYREIFGRHFPTMSVVVVSALVEDRAKVEIEATAMVPE